MHLQRKFAFLVTAVKNLAPFLFTYLAKEGTFGDRCTLVMVRRRPNENQTVHYTHNMRMSRRPRPVKNATADASPRLARNPDV